MGTTIEGVVIGGGDTPPFRSDWMGVCGGDPDIDLDLCIISSRS